jgi:hypothetical protein
MRFAVGVAQPAPAPAAAVPTVERATPLLMPLVILPPIAQETAQPTENSETTTVAALPSQPTPEPTPAPVTIDIPLPEPATVDLTFSPPPVKVKEKPSVAAIAPAPLQAQPSTVIDIPLPEPVAVDLTFSPAPSLAPESAPAAAKPEAEVGPKSEAAPEKSEAAPEKSEAAPEQKPETDARAGSLHEHDSGPVKVAALAEQIPPGTVKLPTKHIPLPKPKAPERIAALSPSAVHHATRTAAAKAKPRRRAVAKRDDFENFFNFPTGKQR